MEKQKRVTVRKKPDRRRAPRSANPKEIAERAYQLYEGRGRTPNHDLDDWLQAERELREGK